MILLLHMWSPIAKSVKGSCDEIVKQTPNQSPIFAIFVEYSGEKSMVDVIIFDSTVGSHGISNFVETSFHRLYVNLYLYTENHQLSLS